MNDECSMGVSNKKDIEMTNKRFEMMMENINQTINQLGKSMESKFNDLEKKMDKMENKLDDFQTKLPEQINGVVDMRFKTGIYAVVKWLTVSVAGVVLISLLAKWILGAM